MSTHPNLSRSAAVLLVVATAAGPVVAQSNDSFTLPVERFRPAIDDKGLVTTESGSIPTHLGFQTGLDLNYALNPLVIRDGNDNVVASIIAHRVAGDALFTIGLFDYVSVGVDLPITFLQLGGEIDPTLADAVGATQGLAGIGVGDLKLVPKVRILREDRHFISLAIIPAITLPTAGGVKFGAGGASYDYGNSYLGEGPGKFAFIPELAVSTNIKGVRLAGNLAYRLRQPVKYLGALEINPEIVYRAGVGYDFSTLTAKMNSLMLFAEIFGATPDRNPFGLLTDKTLSGDAKTIADVDNRLTNPLEWAAGLRYAVIGNVKLEGGFGAGILPGYGSPDLRLFAGVRYTQEDNDKDDDGIEDAVDKCPEDPEDKDGWQDTDGCPDPDNDSDGLPDSADKCPNQPEDVDGYKDDDGCPDDDNDGDGIKDKDDQCPNEPGVAKYKGCPAPDRDKDTVGDDDDKCPDVFGKVELAGCPDQDGDGIADVDDKCPIDPGPKETQGCPDKDGDGILDKDDRCPEQPGPADFKGCPDTDKDGIPDPDDKCPNEPETINGIDDEDGCPDKGKTLVIVTREKIELKETVYFDTGKDTIKKVSFGLLDQVASVMKAHQEIKKIVVEGHTDDQGPDDFNMDLSKRRAASVMKYLIDRGVDAARLSSEGYGETRPIDNNKTKAGREKNRRVEMKILEQE
jgi:outer membrane protein OmpA-like peptidoglycan-associated protein